MDKMALRSKQFGKQGSSSMISTTSDQLANLSVGATSTSSRQLSAEGEDDSKTSRQAERRRRRFRKQKAKENGETKTSKSKQKKALPDEEYDPYDSDPGESYRQHCLRVNGMSTRSCLKLPKFIKQTPHGESETVMTSPPSPMASEMGDILGQTPASLPPDHSRVRYTLRSSITDVSEKQPSGPSVMERRELRPNNVHLNVSHWSDSGARQYMEDRYVFFVNIADWMSG
jgi:hypothetical protein